LKNKITEEERAGKQGRASLRDMEGFGQAGRCAERVIRAFKVRNTVRYQDSREDLCPSPAESRSEFLQITLAESRRSIHYRAEIGKLEYIFSCEARR